MTRGEEGEVEKLIDRLNVVVVIGALLWLGYHVWLWANGLRPPMWP